MIMYFLFVILTKQNTQDSVDVSNISILYSESMEELDKTLSI